MKTEAVRFLYPMIVLLLCGALEEALPGVCSVGLPFLMTSALTLGLVRSRAEAVLLAILAGTLMDALGGMPPATTASFLLVVSLCARAVPQTRLVRILAYPVYQMWLAVWVGFPAGEFWIRLLVSIPAAALTVCFVRPVLLCFERRLVPDAR